MELDEDAFAETFVEPMTDVTAQAALTPTLWSYVEELPANGLRGSHAESRHAVHVYRSGDNRYDHVVLPTEARNRYLVVVLSRQRGAVHGHHLLDLNEKYGLARPDALMISDQARATCARFGVEPAPPAGLEKVGIALATLSLDPLNGARMTPDPGTSGWFIWGGADRGDDDDFFQPLHAHHLPVHCPKVLPYLSLPPGWRFLLGENGYVDVWYDKNLAER